MMYQGPDISSIDDGPEGEGVGGVEGGRSCTNLGIKRKEVR
jgi:hypothetical protein